MYYLCLHSEFHLADSLFFHFGSILPLISDNFSIFCTKWFLKIKRKNWRHPSVSHSSLSATIHCRKSLQVITIQEKGSKTPIEHPPGDAMPSRSLSASSRRLTASFQRPTIKESNRQRKIFQIFLGLPSFLGGNPDNIDKLYIIIIIWIFVSMRHDLCLIRAQRPDHLDGGPLIRRLRLLI